MDPSKEPACFRIKFCLSFTLVTLLLLSTGEGIQAQTRSFKRGLAYGYLSQGDMQALTSGLSWWYNWGLVPESTVSQAYQNYGFDFVPMIWGGSFDSVQLCSYLAVHPDVKYILGFNEPNFLAQAHLTPTQAAALWPRIEAIADKYNLKIVGPAVNYCGSCVSENGVTYTDPVQYLDDFFSACPSCRVDYIAIHCYMNTVSALNWYIGLFKKYKKPIWLTEFAGWESNGVINNVNDQTGFMVSAVDMLESDIIIYRYAWFIGRTSGGAGAYPYIDLLGANGVLTPLGQTYVNMPVHDTTTVLPVPGKIEAEKYSRQSGTMIELTSDFSGFADVGYIDPGDWLEYKIHVGYTGNFSMVFRIASVKACNFDVLLDGNFLFNETVDNTGGYQNWSSFVRNTYLEEGDHTLKIRAGTNGFNLNYIEISSLSGITDHSSNRTTLYPNPGNDKLFIESPVIPAKIELMDVTGKIMQSWSGTNSISLKGIPSGLYLVRGWDNYHALLFNQKYLIQK